MSDHDLDYQRRFGGIARLYGDAALSRFENAHLCVIGIGGVGSWAVEALARSAVGHLTLIDLDHVAVSNINRQLHALTPTLGQAKVSAMAERVRAINPRVQISEIDDFLTEDNLPTLIDGRHTMVIDCIDQMRVKVALIAHCRRQHIPLLVSGGAGGRVDAGRVQIADLAQTEGDPLLAKIRAELRRRHGFPRDGGKFGIEAAFSSETLRRPGNACTTDSGPTGLNCAGFGSSVCVTAAFGFALAGRALNRIAG
ncbi:tRNA threonylcarbamoyladenosine dehydratase [Chitinimonas lacunae]|uniref:ThiF family adenylyltransferase n=1 Tax=Chitinimonas lacunae TaxID=1963018 RepID=A0ABV8MS88_9NEIS